MRLVIIVYCCLIFTIINAQSNSRNRVQSEIDALRIKMLSSNTICGRITGAGETKAYKAFKELIEKASIHEFKILARDKKAIVQGYAFLALVLRDKKEALLIKHRFKFSFKKINTRLYGCIGERLKLKDFVNYIYSLPDDQMGFIYKP